MRHAWWPVAVLCLLAPAAVVAQRSSDAHIDLEVSSLFGAQLADAEQHTPLAGSIRSGPGCGSFSRRRSVQALLDASARGADSLREQAHSAATEAITGLRWLALKRAFPEVADLFDQELARAETQVETLVGRCNAARQAVSEAGNPSEAWAETLRAMSWRQALTQTDDLQATSDQIDQALADGVPWVFGGRAGGAGQDEIRVVRDVATATAQRLNLQLPLAELVAGEPDYAEWITRIVGDGHVRYDGGDMHIEVTLGEGLWPETRRLALALVPTLYEAVAAVRQGQGLPARLHAFIAFGLDAAFMHHLATMSEPDTGAVITRLSEELAVAIATERALLARQILIAGRSLPPVVAVKPAQSLLTDKLAVLNDDISMMRFEITARRELQSSMGSLLRTVLEQH